MENDVSNDERLTCGLCRIELKPGTVHISYMRSTFPAQLLVCPGCGQIYVPEELALGRMAEVEQTLEEK